MTEPAKSNHAQDIAKLEELTFTYWQDGLAGGHPTNARQVLATGLLAAAYDSLLADDPANRTAEEATALGAMEAAAQAARDYLDTALGRPVGPRYP